MVKIHHGQSIDGHTEARCGATDGRLQRHDEEVNCDDCLRLFQMHIDRMRRLAQKIEQRLREKEDHA